MTTTKALKTTEMTEVRNKLEGLAQELEITDHESLEYAVQVKKANKQYKKSVKEYWDPLCGNAHDTWKALTSRRKEFLDPADNVDKIIDKKVDTYQREQERIAQAERAKAEKEAREAAEKERLAEIEHLQETGELEEAETVAAEPLDVRPVIEAPKEKVEGFSTSKRYYAEVVNLGDFLSFLAGEPRFHYLIKDFPMKELNKLAVAQKEMFDIPGVEAKYKIVSSTRS